MVLQTQACPGCGETVSSFPCPLCGALEVPHDDADRAAEDRDRAAELRDLGAEGRDEQGRQQAQDDSDQEQTWSDDDQEASQGDQWSADQDQRAADREYARGGDEVAYTRGTEARERSRRARDTAALHRDATSAERALRESTDGHEDAFLLNQQDRTMAADDRAEAAGDRKESARERADALKDKGDFATAAQRAIETLESMTDAFFTLDPEWNFTYLNPQSALILQRDRTELVGRSIWQEFPILLGSAFERQYRRAAKEQVPVRFEAEYEPLGTDSIFEVRVHPVAAGLAVYFTDVTEERRRDAMLQQSERLEMLGQLAAGIVHDFKNILTVVGGFAQLGKARSKDAKIDACFDSIESASERAGALTQQLLAFARQQELTPAVIDLNETIEGFSSLLHQLLPDGVDLEIELSEEPVMVFVDPSQLEQVALNLVVNARDATEAPGCITISTSTEPPKGVVHDLAGPLGWLRVRDTGAGIPDEILPRIFDPFFSTKPTGIGTGLGLATIYGIVSQSGGSIFVDSSVGAGTTMSVAIPAQPGPLE